MSGTQKKTRLGYLFIKFLRWLLLFLFSASSCIWIFLWLYKNDVYHLFVAGLALILATILAVFLIRRLILEVSFGHLNSYSIFWRATLLIAYLLAGIWLSFNIPLVIPVQNAPSFAPTFYVKIIYRMSTGFAMGLSLFFMSVWLTQLFKYNIENYHNPPLLKSSIKYALPMIAVWGIYLLAYFPGMMSADSMVQWEQILTGHFVDHHPAFHTFLLWLLTRVYFSPAIIAIAQIIALAIVAGLWFAFFERLGIKHWIIWIVAFVFAITPVNGTMVNTLWKDIPYSISVLGLILNIAQIVVSRGSWLTSLSAKFILGITLVFVMLLRHDGLVLGLGTFLFLILGYPSQWKPWLVSGLICAILYLGIRGPVYKWVSVQKSSTLIEGSLSPYSIAAYATPGTVTDFIISSIQITSSSWGCDIWNKISPDKSYSDLDRSISPFQIAVNLADRLPNLLSYDARCSRSLDWIIWDPYGEVRNTSHVEVLIDPNPFGIEPDSKIPQLREWISQWVYKTSHDTKLNWFIWRPALFLYFNLFLAGILIIRNRDVRFGLLSVPLLIQSITFTVILAAPNFRYHYVVYLASLITIPLFFLPPIREKLNAETSSDQTS